MNFEPKKNLSFSILSQTSHFFFTDFFISITYILFLECDYFEKKSIYIVFFLLNELF